MEQKTTAKKFGTFSRQGLLLPLPPLRILIAEPYSAIRDMLSTHCREVLRHRPVEHISSVEELTMVPVGPGPDVILLAAELAEQSTSRIIQAVRDSALPRPGFLVYGLGCSSHRMRHLEAIQVNGYFDLRTERIDSLEAAINAAGSRRRFFSDSFLERQDERRDNPGAYSKILSDRQISVLELVARFRTDAEISRELKLSVRTVEWHRLEIMHKLELGSAQELLRYAWEQGFVVGLSTEHHGAKIHALPQNPGLGDKKHAAVVSMAREAS